MKRGWPRGQPLCVCVEVEVDQSQPVALVISVSTLRCCTRNESVELVASSALKMLSRPSAVAPVPVLVPQVVLLLEVCLEE